jgi:hypothetical protein
MPGEHGINILIKLEKDARAFKKNINKSLGL